MPVPTRPAEGNIALLFDKASGKRAWCSLTTHITKSVPNQQSVTVWSLSSATNSFQSSTGEITIILLLLFVLSKAIEKQKHVCASDGRENNLEGEPFNTSKPGIIVFLQKLITTIGGISRELNAGLNRLFVTKLLSSNILTWPFRPCVCGDALCNKGALTITCRQALVEQTESHLLATESVCICVCALFPLSRRCHGTYT